jgi:hypothetical protein
VLPKPHEAIKGIPLFEREGQDKEEVKNADAPVLSKNQQKKLAKKSIKETANKDEGEKSSEP